MRHVGQIVEMNAAEGVGWVRGEGGNLTTIVYLQDLRQAGISPLIGTRLIYAVGVHPSGSGVTCAVGLESLGAPAVAAAPAAPPAPVRPVLVPTPDKPA